ncbi:hypothetical protein H2200_001080 [Cladophialophora chaetospira]|uniref:Uncharacterized protein n=1 Tax=Cladophialophora chaetospira TaxID=386627 RepID=A0AA38XKA4_9EURO|nr:hypothetical protein H2200_001080 [Cladophialophora chaetospira]
MAAFTILFLLSCSLFCSAAPANASAITWINCAEQPPFTLNTTSIDLTKLPSTLHCGRVVVPMNYAKPIGPKNNITLGIAMYRPQNPKGVIFHNPGTTDEATIFAWQAALNLSDVFGGLEDYDLMMMDVRGTYNSNPLNVSLEIFQPLLGPFPTTQAEFDNFKNLSASAVQSFIQLSTPPGILQHVGTREIVQDYEIIRRSLGYEKINFVGSSGGSYKAAQYATTFPKHVGNFVLDSVVPHGLSVNAQAQDMIVANNRALVRADAFCQNNATCPFKSMGRGSVPKVSNSTFGRTKWLTEFVGKAFESIVTEATSKPLPASLCVNSDKCVSPVTVSNIRQGLFYLLANTVDFPNVIEAIALGASGDGSGFALAAGDPIPDVTATWAMSSVCNDYAFQKSLQAGSLKDPHKIRMTQGWEVLLWCSGWPFPTPPTASLPQFKAPIVLLTADFDVNSPTEWARSEWKKYPQGALISRHGDDHVSWILPHQPATKIAKTFLRTGKLPAPRNETQVAVYRPGMKLAPIPNPYNVGTGPIAGDIDSS